MSLRDEITATIGERVEDAAFYADAIADALMPLVERAVKEAAKLAITEQQLTVREIVADILK